MKRLEEARRTYEEIPIPEELSERISMEVEQWERKRKIVDFRKRSIKKGLFTAAAMVVIFTAAVNTSTAFAKSMDEIPIIGAVARVLTFRSYETEVEDMKISVEIPSIETISRDFQELADTVNQEIYNLCQQYADGAMERAVEYRQAFLDTGGTEEEWADHHIEIKIWYEVKSQTEKYLSLAVKGTENWSTAYSRTRYYNFDLENGTLIGLEDVLGADWKQIADESIRSQMAEDEPGYWDEFKGIDENTAFYMNEEGNPVVVFERYEIAPGAAGEPEFEIVK